MEEVRDNNQAMRQENHLLRTEWEIITNENNDAMRREIMQWQAFEAEQARNGTSTSRGYDCQHPDMAHQGSHQPPPPVWNHGSSLCVLFSELEITNENNDAMRREIMHWQEFEAAEAARNGTSTSRGYDQHPDMAHQETHQSPPPPPPNPLQ
jgi:hypothetical protein